MTSIVYPNTLTNAGVETISQLMANLDTILAVVNGDLDNANLLANALLGIEKLSPGSEGQYIITAAGVAAVGAAGSATPDYPWLVQINPFMTPVSHINWNTPSVDGNALLRGYQGSSGAQNEEIAWDVVLGVGTWRIDIISVKAANHGIYTAYLDAVSVGTMDAYNAATLYNQILSITGVVVAASGKKRLKLKMETKNAAASSYVGSISLVSLQRTA